MSVNAIFSRDYLHELEGFTRILDIVKSVFKTVMLISHLDSLKDSADSVINIEKKNGYANVNC